MSFHPFSVMTKRFNKYELKSFRATLRANLTSAEASLWSLLKNKQLEGKKFRRQHSVDNYVLDFYCPEERLAIELDGEPHFTAHGQEKDQIRTQHLEALGIRVIRFENKDVHERSEVVLEIIKSHFTSKFKSKK